MNTILSLGIISLTSIIIAKLLKKLKLPSVTGYLLAGLLLGPSISGIISNNTINELSFISDLALGLIAFHIGESFELRQIKKLAKNVITITFFQAFITVIVVYFALFTFTKDFAFSLVIAAISAATAPAATIMVIKEYKAKGNLTDTLISVVALDDLVCIILYSIATAIAQISLSGSLSIAQSIIPPIIEIFGSFLVGGIIGFTISYFINKKANQEVGIIYLVSRSVGKISGAHIGGALTKAEPKIKNRLGLGLLPQAGVAIGLATLSASTFPTMGTKILNLIMAAVFVYELIGPVLTKNILIKSGEAQEN